MIFPGRAGRRFGQCCLSPASGLPSTRRPTPVVRALPPGSPPERPPPPGALCSFFLGISLSLTLCPFGLRRGALASFWVAPASVDDPPPQGVHEYIQQPQQYDGRHAVGEEDYQDAGDRRNRSTIRRQDTSLLTPE